MTFLGWLSDPFKGLSDLQLEDEKGTLNHLVVYVSHLLVTMALWGYIFLAMTFASCAAYFKTFTNFLQKKMPESFFLMRKF